MIKIPSDIRDPYKKAKESLKPLKIYRDAVSYALIAIFQKIVEKRILKRAWIVSDKTISKIKREMWAGYLNHGYTDKADFAKFWNQLEPILRTHRALVKFYIKNQVPLYSPTYPAWNLTTMVRGNYAQAMLVAIGEGLDYNGDPYKIKSDDPFYHGVACGWTMNEARYRQMKARAALLSSHQALILGAGYLPELSPIYGGSLPSKLKIDAVDSNFDIDSDALTEKYPFVKYYHAEMLDFLKECPPGRYDTIILPGVMSYNLEDFDQIMELLKRALGEGGVLIFDLQVMHPELMYIYLMLDWTADSDQKMKLINLKEAVAMVQAVCDKLELTMEHSQSGYYKTTCAELFEITKT